MTKRTTRPPSGFSKRHIGHSDVDQRRMLTHLGEDSLDAFMRSVIPGDVVSEHRCDVPAALPEPEAVARLREFAQDNEPGVPLLGLGYHRSHLPAVVRRHVLENPAWYTAYTPYQAEISQGRLEVLLHFQTMVAELTGMDVANASLLDEATAAAEGMGLCNRRARGDSRTFVVARDVHPHVLDVVQTRAEALDLRVVVMDAAPDMLAEGVAADVFGVLLQYPGTTGRVRDLTATIDSVHEQGAAAVVVTDLLACTMLRPPGEMGADVVVGHTQRLGLPLWYGGPHAGFIATREADRRQLPGRLVGISVDAGGRPALRLALQTREQHIRRERATSNICTAQSLPAIISTFYAIHHGPDGLTAIAEAVHERACMFADGVRSAGYVLEDDSFFDTVTVIAPDRAHELVTAARRVDIDLRLLDESRVVVAFDETSTDQTVDEVLRVFDADHSPSPGRLPDLPLRTSSFLQQPVFNDYHSETALMRLMRRLGDRDLALDRTMIPLGSCTMKLNAAAELEPIVWSEFADLHPFSPVERALGTRALLAELSQWLLALTGFDELSLQPNSGAQGEFAGLLAIRRYHEQRGHPGRTVVLIPESAHGTNAASAAMAGLDVQVVACDDHGNVDPDELAEQCQQLSDRLAALMVTYPSTHGVFEPTIRSMCDLVHAHGGQVYLDGANLNAMVGWSRPADLGADIAHLNLHKTFAIPHGGGGPGVGPVGAKTHLARHLPGHLVSHAPSDKGTTARAVAGAPFGSVGILPISWAYLAMMGRDGLEAATAAAVLAANYIASRLGDAFPILFCGAGGRVAHECILDVRPITKATGVTAEDIAKRLIDYGFHAPTMAFPVAGTLMVEPTESEPLDELDRFCDAMLTIRAEIDDIAKGRVPLEDSPLRHAPHPAADVLADDWSRSYPRSVAAVIGRDRPTDKYWPPVSRIDNAAGDRNPMCACPPLADWRDPERTS